jgi:formylglycine-generating enzyme required for sulfatase activity
MSGIEDGSLAEAMRRVAEAPTDNFVELARLAGLDPARHMRLCDWSGVDFRGCNLRGFDFSCARLRNCQFEGARISGAHFDRADISGANIRQAADWPDYVKGWKNSSEPVSDGHLRPGAVFQDAPFAPEMVAVPPGRFWMGSKDGEGYGDERPRHEVTIPRAIAVGRYPVTFEEWDFAQADKEWSEITGVKPRKPEDRGWGRDRRPVIDVEWKDAAAYTIWLWQKTGQLYRLLSEAEWEYACRAGSEADYCFGDSEAELRDYAWYGPNSNSKTHPVGEKKPNGFGLYDMHGNVWEWCLDGRRDYTSEPATDPAGHLDGASRALRGGSWNNYARHLRAAYRNANDRELRFHNIGFRCARVRQ